MKRQKKTSTYKVVEEAVSSGDNFPLILTLVLGAWLFVAYVRSRLRPEYDESISILKPGGGFSIQEIYMNRLYLSILILVIAALACGSETATPAPGSTAAPISTTVPSETSVPVATTAPASTMGQVGDRVESNGIAMTVNSVLAVDSVNDILTPDEGNIFLVVDVTVENLSQESADYNFFYFKVKDSEGFEYTTTIAAPDPTFKSGELSSGDKVRGNVAFEVPADSKGLVLSYKAIDFSGDDAIEFELGDAPAIE